MKLPGPHESERRSIIPRQHTYRAPRRSMPPPQTQSAGGVLLLLALVAGVSALAFLAGCVLMRCSCNERREQRAGGRGRSRHGCRPLPTQGSEDEDEDDESAAGRAGPAAQRTRGRIAGRVQALEQSVNVLRSCSAGTTAGTTAAAGRPASWAAPACAPRRPDAARPPAASAWPSKPARGRPAASRRRAAG